VSFWAEVFLGVIALATCTMAAIHVGLIVYGWSVARRINGLLLHVEQQVKPLAESIHAVAGDAARISALAAGQVERLDRLVTDVTNRVEQTTTMVHDMMLKPLRNGVAVMSGVQAAVGVFRGLTRPSRPARARSEEDEALFIG
jgi:hypothetical protein